MGTYKGVVGFPTTNLNADEDTIDFWWGPLFHVANNTGSRVLFYCFYDSDNWSGIRLWEDRIHFIIRNNGNEYKVASVALPHVSPGETPGGEGVTAWYHVVCSWGPEGMRIFINDREAEYVDNPDYRTGLDYTGGLGTLPTWFMIGNTAAGADYYMDSMMDELRVYGYQETSFPQKPQKDADHAF
jgi:hypothetical protein